MDERILTINDRGDAEPCPGVMMDLRTSLLLDSGMGTPHATATSNFKLQGAMVPVLVIIHASQPTSYDTGPRSCVAYTLVIHL